MFKRKAIYNYCIDTITLNEYKTRNTFDENNFVFNFLPAANN